MPVPQVPPHWRDVGNTTVRISTGACFQPQRGSSSRLMPRAVFATTSWVRKAFAG
jgi:hypothetical protein